MRKTSINRRTFLKSSGVVVALPLLDAMAPAIASTNAELPRRLVTVCGSLGFYSPSWFPSATGHEYEASEYLSLLAEHRSQFSILSGLAHAHQTGRQAHNSEITWLTSAQRPGLDGFHNTISVDQVAANHLGYVTRYPSVALGTASEQSQSYTSSGVMVPAFTSPSAVFAKMFLQGKPEEIEREVQSLQDGGSILDHLKTQTTALQRNVSTSDRSRLDAYYEAVRSAERELKEAGAWLHRPKPKVDASEPEDVSDRSDLLGRIAVMLRLIPLILETDSTRVITLMMQDHGVVPTIDGVTMDQHNLSHHGQDPTKIAQLKVVETRILEIFNEFLTDMRSRSEGEGSLLDQTTVMLGSNLGNANSHRSDDLPILIAGGSHRHGQHMKFGGEENLPLSNLFVYLLQWMGVPTESFGHSTGTLTWA